MQDSKTIYMILTNGFDPDVRVYKEAKYLVKKGFNVEIICWDRKCEYQDKLEDIIEGIKIKRFPIQSKPGTGMRQLIPYIKFMKEVRKYLKDKKYSYLHCHDFDGILIGMCTRRRKEKEIIFDMHEIYNNYAYANNIIFNKLFNIILNKTNHIIYVNDVQIKNIENKGKLVFLPNYPEERIYIPIKKDISNKTRVNYIGSLRDYDSLTSLAQIYDRDSNLEVGFYGIGTCYEQLKKKYTECPITIYGKYDGILESGQIYRNTDILYCSYNPKVENWKNAYPIKLYEAIITLTPIIVTKNTVVGEFVIENEIGEVIEYGNTNSILEAINKITGNYEKYIENLKKISNKYRWEEVEEHLDKIYEGDKL